MVHLFSRSSKYAEPHTSLQTHKGARRFPPLTQPIAYSCLPAEKSLPFTKLMSLKSFLEIRGLCKSQQYPTVLQMALANQMMRLPYKSKPQTFHYILQDIIC